ncbi:MAG: YdhR family protein [Leptolyngbyaceae bacterium]|nr:YdhR family protein [Leptolyngbyaceae bacterium]
MSHTILQINLTYTCARGELKDAFSHAVDAIATFPGLVWKIWIINDETKEAGGVYCFEDKRALDAYVNSLFITVLKADPMISDVNIKTFDAIAPLTAKTRGPIPLNQLTA